MRGWGWYLWLLRKTYYTYITSWITSQNYIWFQYSLLILVVLFSSEQNQFAQSACTDWLALSVNYMWGATMLVPLRRAPTWHLHTKLYKIRWNCLSNNPAMKNRTDLNLDDVFCLSIICHILDSWLNLLSGYDFYFRCKPPIVNTNGGT